MLTDADKFSQIGAEQTIAANLIARLEYRYSDFGTNVYRDLPATVPISIKYATHDVRLGLAYKF
ncbi:outer membrane protein [Aminobacter sp. Piv2-1]|uniref:outer membrane protein n=1 Tax=Aminobacter sp. Piv2-1 TaxID=3031122 RepID=UPI0030A46B35